jgi:hypothetical protein
MQVLTGTVKNGTIEINQPVAAADGTSVVIFIIPKITEINSSESLLGKWDWYTEERENVNQEIARQGASSTSLLRSSQ